jgi:hypothetical protein
MEKIDENIEMRVPRTLKVRVNGMYGVATNDADYQVKIMKERKPIWQCPYYCRWAHMLARCYSKEFQKTKSTYIGCAVCDEWLLFSNFKRWMENQDWRGKELDKDILFEGNKVYSPETCAFVHKKVNMLTVSAGAIRGEYPLGVSFDKKKGKVKAECCNIFTLKHEFLGYFHCPQEAHNAWKRRKHELACELADSEYVTDPRVAAALRIRYL